MALQFVTAVACPVGPPAPAHTTWTLSGDTGDYRTSYRITDDTGLCLQPQDAAARAADPNPFTDGPDISKLVVQPCTDSTLQKWNPPPDLGNAAPLNTIGER